MDKAVRHFCHHVPSNHIPSGGKPWLSISGSAGWGVRVIIPVPLPRRRRQGEVARETDRLNFVVCELSLRAHIGRFPTNLTTNQSFGYSIWTCQTYYPISACLVGLIPGPRTPGIWFKATPGHTQISFNAFVRTCFWPIGIMTTSDM